jgi:AcrR family transcriptional regulator
VNERATRHRNAPVGLSESEVLTHGLEAFAALGYDATSVRELAKRLEVSHNFINDRYASKAGFWLAVIEEAMRPRLTRMESLTTDGDRTDADRLSHIVVEFYRDAVDLQAMNRIIADESSRDSERLDYLTEHYIRPVFDMWRPLERPAAPRLERSALSLERLRHHDGVEGQLRVGREGAVDHASAVQVSRSDRRSLRAARMASPPTTPRARRRGGFLLAAAWRMPAAMRSGLDPAAAGCGARTVSS